MNDDRFARFINFLDRLGAARIPYWIKHSRDDAVMIVAFAPGQYWEIEFLEDGSIDVERFRSTGHIDDESVLDELFALWADDQPSQKIPKKTDEIIARK